jgi:hypothetical protein
MKICFEILVGRPEGKEPIIRPRRRWDNIKMDLKQESVDQIYLSQDRDRWRVLVDTNELPVFINGGRFLD